ncbi:MAG: YARHG domain-containing protein [Deltaproteobacteria bacterium]|nr:YARHG domain-containing protein [Deltaproteobacteria bacterium]
MRWLVPVVVLAATACGCGESAAVGVAASPISGSAAATDARGIDPVLAQRCDEPCLFLTDTPLDQLAEVYQARCGKVLVPDNANCQLLDYQRNCIFAAHGLRFRKAKWKAYTTRPWYRMRPEFRSSELTALERINVHELKLRARACRHHDVHVSTADYARIQAWMVGYAKGVPALPGVLVLGEDRVAAAEFGPTIIKLAIALDARRENGTWMAYHDPEPAVTGALPGAKLRDVIVDFSPRDRDCDDDCSGPFLHFAFDAKDQLVALLLTDH